MSGNSPPKVALMVSKLHELKQAFEDTLGKMKQAIEDTGYTKDGYESLKLAEESKAEILQGLIECQADYENLQVVYRQFEQLVGDGVVEVCATPDEEEERQKAMWLRFFDYLRDREPGTITMLLRCMGEDPSESVLTKAEKILRGQIDHYRRLWEAEIDKSVSKQTLLGEVEKRCDDSQKENRRLLEQISMYQKKEAAAEKRCAKLEAELAKLRDRADAENKNLRKELKDANGYIRILQKDSHLGNHTSQELERVNDTAKAYQSQVENMRNQLKESQDRERFAQQAINDGRVMLKSVQKELSAAKARITAMEVDHDTLADEARTAKVETRANRAAHDQVRATLDERTRDLTEIREARERDNLEAAQLRNMVNHHGEMHREYMSHVEQLQRDLATETARREETEERVGDLEAHIVGLEERIQQDTNANDAVRQHLRDEVTLLRERVRVSNDTIHEAQESLIRVRGLLSIAIAQKNRIMTTGDELICALCVGSFLQMGTSPMDMVSTSLQVVTLSPYTVKVTPWTVLPVPVIWANRGFYALAIGVIMVADSVAQTSAILDRVVAMQSSLQTDVLGAVRTVIIARLDHVLSTLVPHVSTLPSLLAMIQVATLCEARIPNTRFQVRQRIQDHHPESYRLIEALEADPSEGGLQADGWDIMTVEEEGIVLAAPQFGTSRGLLLVIVAARSVQWLEAGQLTWRHGVLELAVPEPKRISIQPDGRLVWVWTNKHKF